LRSPKDHDGIVFFQILRQRVAKTGAPAIYFIPEFRDNGADPSWIGMFLMDDQ
jgi:hypothetical protein